MPAAATVTTFGNSASVDSATLDPDPANNSASASVDVVRRADVGVTKALAPGTPANPPPGSTVNYVVTVRNNGPSSADGVLLTDVVDPRLTGSTPGCTSSGATLSCPLGSLAPQQELSFTVPAVIDATLPAGTVIPNTVAVSSLTPDPVDTNQESTATFTTGAPQADLETVKSGPATVVAGQAATYTISVVNHGPSDASTVTVTDTLPLGATVVSAASTRGSCAPPATCDLGPLPVGATATITVDVVFDPDTAIGPATNAATASSVSTVDPNPGNDTGATTANVTGNADVSVVKTADPATAVPGDPIEFHISAHNAGPSTARGRDGVRRVARRLRVRVRRGHPGDVRRAGRRQRGVCGRRHRQRRTRST